MLYYLKQEVIGEHADSVLKGADIRYVIPLLVQYPTHTHTLKYLTRYVMHLLFKGC